MMINLNGLTASASASAHAAERCSTGRASPSGASKSESLAAANASVARDPTSIGTDQSRAATQRHVASFCLWPRAFKLTQEGLR